MRRRPGACRPPNGLHRLPSATPLERSFNSVSHFPAAQCSGEKPGPRFGSAPRSSRNSAWSRCRRTVATTSAVVPSAAAALTSAPASSNASVVSRYPSRAARTSAV